jgi:hypothetical protein
MLSRLIEFAAIIPDPATAGTPIPGNVESPQTSSPLTGGPANGKEESPARMAGP